MWQIYDNSGEEIQMTAILDMKSKKEIKEEIEREKILIRSSRSTKAILIDSLGTAVLRRSKQFESWARCWKCQLSSMPELPFHKNSYNVNQIIFLNYDPYEYEYFSKCAFYVVTHVSHTNKIIYINSYSTHPYQAKSDKIKSQLRWDGSDEGSQHMLLCKINKNYP